MSHSCFVFPYPFQSPAFTLDDSQAPGAGIKHAVVYGSSPPCNYWSCLGPHSHQSRLGDPYFNHSLNFMEGFCVSFQL